MKKKILKVLLPVLALSSISALTVYAGDNNIKFNESTLTIGALENNKEPLWSWSGSVYLDSDNYCNITTYNNIFNDSPKITNDASNQGSITVRAINEKGEVVCSEVTISLGETKKLNQIPYNAGKVTFQAKAATSGNYRVNLT